MRVHVLKIITLDGIPSIHLVIIVIITSCQKLLLEQDPLKIIILISRWILSLAIRIVVIVVLIVPASILVEEVNVLGGLNLEALSVGDLCEGFEALWVWSSVGLHGMFLCLFINFVNL